MDEAVLLDEQAVAREARSISGELVARGCRAGDKVALLCGNSPGFVAARDAATAAALSLVPINPKLAPPEVSHILGHSGARIVIVEALLRARLDRALADLAHPPHVLVLGKTFSTPPGREKPTPAIGATLIYTSGTTGIPKACSRSDAQETARARELIASYSVTAEDVHLIACPLSHSAPGIFLRACRAVGAATAMLRRFSPERFLTAVQKLRATFFFLVPTQYERLLALGDEVLSRYDISSVRAALVAGAPISPGTKRRLVDWLGPRRLWEFYGSSETGTVAVLPPADQLTKPGSVGRPPPAVEVVIVDEADNEIAIGSIGEIYVRSPTIMTGYLDPSSGGLHRPAQRDGFISVGDLGYFDDDGYLYLVDRKHDTIITGGVNVYPAEVERAVCEHPDVAGAVAFGAPDQEWGQLIAVAVALSKPGRDRSPGADRHRAIELRGFLRDRIAAYKIPKAIAFISLEQLPVGSSGKPLRRKAVADLVGSDALRRYDH